MFSLLARANVLLLKRRSPQIMVLVIAPSPDCREAVHMLGDPQEDQRVYPTGLVVDHFLKILDAKHVGKAGRLE